MATNLGHATKPTKSKVNTKSPEFVANYSEMLGLVDQLQDRLHEATFQGSDRLLDIHRSRGLLLGKAIQKVTLTFL